jgi:threonine synthase
VAAAAERSAGLASPMVILGCAHPAKFPAHVERASGVAPALPTDMAGLLTAEEQYQHLPADYGAISGHIARTIAERRG